MTAQFARPQQRGRSGIGHAAEPHAALLIDFDNVTMGIRSDLTKELKNLLNSDIIKGKVAVQRAYADWRRYPQYIVPLAESSVDLIFAPAYGSAKKNATDIRLAIDAIELVFTRPEIGTIILLSGDSDFSSMVLKLKEYGKYVIGVGIRESASDLLVQNCDEYYSYSALTGLTRAGDEAPAVSEDPWELVEVALRQMRENDDVMRSDRLKQVLLELDPSFDEKALGFQKFNKFLQEAASRGLLSLRKQDNGQFEIGPPEALAVTESQAVEARGETRRGRGRRGRGRREETRREEAREPRREATAAAPASAAAAPAAAGPAPEAAPATVVAEPPKPEAAPPEVRRPKPEPVAVTPIEEPARAPDAARRDVAARARADTPGPAGAEAAQEPERAKRPARVQQPVPAPAVESRVTPPPAPATETRPSAVGDLAASYELLRRAASDLVRKSGQSARDSDVKRRMLELEAGWDEAALGFSKFSRFLRQAHDAEVITLRKGDNGVYDVLPGEGEAAREPVERGRGRTGRGRDRERGAADAAQPTTARAEDVRPEVPTEVTPPKTRPSAPAAPVAETAETPAPAQSRGPSQYAARSAPASPAPAETRPKLVPSTPAAVRREDTLAPPARTPSALKTGSAQPAALLFRRGSRGRSPSGPPPLLEGQAAGIRTPVQPPAPQPLPPATADAVPATSAAQPREQASAAQSREQPAASVAQGRQQAAAQAREQPAAPASTAAEPVAAAPVPSQEKPVAGVAAPESVAAQLRLPQAPEAVASYIAENYKGVGPKSVQTLIEEFGAAHVFDALEKLPDRVRELLGAARGDRLLAAWRQDTQRQRGGGAVAPSPRSTRARKTPAKRPAKASAPTGKRTAAKKSATTVEVAAVTAGPAPVQTTPAAKSGRGGGGRAPVRSKPPAR